MKGHITVYLRAAKTGIPLRLGDWFAVPGDLMFVVRLTECWIRGLFSL